MDMPSVLVALAIFAPSLWIVATRSWRTPDAVSTPTWMAATNAAFLFVGPFVSLLFGGGPPPSAPGQAWTIVWVTATYYASLAIVYTTLRKWVLPGPTSHHGEASAIATLRSCVLSSRPTELLTVGAIVITVASVLNLLYSLHVSGGGDYFKMARLPYAVVVLNTLTMPMMLGLSAGLAWLAASRQQPQVRLLAGFLILAILANTFAAGRRELLWFTIMIGFGILWSGKRRLGIAIPVVSAMAYVVLIVFAPVFLRARLIYSSPHSPGVMESFRVALDEQRAAVVDESSETLRDNMSSRFNTVDFWAEMYVSYSPGELDGQILTQGIIMSLPRAFVGFWKYHLGATDETVLGTGDICNNVALESWLDLAHIGPPLYGAVFGTVFALADYLLALTAFRVRVLAILSSSVMVRLLLGPEVNLITCFSEFRTVLIYFLLAVLVAIFFGRRPMRATSDLAMRRAVSAGAG